MESSCGKEFEWQVFITNALLGTLNYNSIIATSSFNFRIFILLIA